MHRHTDSLRPVILLAQPAELTSIDTDLASVCQQQSWFDFFYQTLVYRLLPLAVHLPAKYSIK